MSLKPKPTNDYCVFQYDRVWRSLEDKDVEFEMQKQFARSRTLQLRRPSPRMTEEEHEELHSKYWEKGEPELHKARMANMSRLGSGKLFTAVSLPHPVARRLHT